MSERLDIINALIASSISGGGGGGGGELPRTTAILKGDGNGGARAAVAGTDFVAPASGKGLSSNDYTAADKQKLDGIEEGAEVNAVDSVNGKTGAVVLDAEDVGALPADTTLSDLPTDTQHRTVSDAEKTAWNDKADGADLEDIAAVIPAQATAQNQLADKDFVNSSIATNTANFCGTFNSVSELEAYSGTLTNNDYAFVIGTDSHGNTVYNRYKYNGTAWVFEYALNNSSFTADQFSAINSGITSALIEGYNSHVADDDIHLSAAEKAAWDGKYNKPSGGIPLSDLAPAIQLDHAGLALFMGGLASAEVGSAPLVNDTHDIYWLRILPIVDTSALAGTLALANVDNKIIEPASPITSAITITAASISAGERFGVSLVLAFGAGGSVNLSALSSTGDDINEAAAGETWEINILRGRAVVKKL